MEPTNDVGIADFMIRTGYERLMNGHLETSTPSRATSEPDVRKFAACLDSLLYGKHVIIGTGAGTYEATPGINGGVIVTESMRVNFDTWKESKTYHVGFKVGHKYLPLESITSINEVEAPVRRPRRAYSRRELTTV